MTKSKKKANIVGRQTYEPMSAKCPHCGSTKIVKNGFSYYGKQNYKCKHCKRQSVERAPEQVYGQRYLIGKLLLERISLRGICRTLEMSMCALMSIVKEMWQAVPAELPVGDLADAQVEVFCVEADEMWSFVGSKDNVHWIWLAIERKTRLVVGFHIGDRTQQDAQALKLSIPDHLLDKAIFFTDGLAAYQSVFDKVQHYPEGKPETVKIERLNNTIRQRCSRLVRKGLSFSKSRLHHYMAVYFFLVIQY